MFNLSYGLYLVSSFDGKKDNVSVNNSFMQITSTNPVRCVLSINKAGYNNEVIAKTKKLNLSVLAEGTSFDIFKHFGFASGRAVDKLKGYSSIKRSENGLVYITDNTNAYFSLEVEKSYDFISHTVFRCKVVASEVLSDKKSLTYSDYITKIKPKKEVEKMTGYRCTICDFVYEGETLPDDFICPICSHGPSDFVKA